MQHLLYRPNGQEDQLRSEAPGNVFSRLPIGTINVIFAAPRRTGSYPSRVISVARLIAEDSNSKSKRAKVEIWPVLSFSDEDKMGTIQPYNDALVVTFRIGGYDVKRMMVDQGSGAEIMYPDLYRGLNLKLEDLIAYDSPLVSFDRKVVILKGQIRLPVQAGSEVVEVDFIMVDACSSYTAIMARPWLYALRAISLTLHLKVKYLVGDWVEELVRSQSMARQCLIAAIMHRPATESSASIRGAYSSQSL